MHQRIVLTASALVLLVVALASFFSMRITMQEEQGILQEQLLNAARYAAASAQDEAALNRVAALMNARVTRMDRSGEILYDTSGQVGYYLDQPDVVTALSNGTGTEISFQGRRRCRSPYPSWTMTGRSCASRAARWSSATGTGGCSPR